MTTTTTEAPDPCPFCGSIVLARSVYCMTCIQCGAAGPDGDHATDEAAIAAWNSRSHPQDAQIVQPPLLGWTFNHTQQQTDEDGPVPGTWEIGWLDDEDGSFSSILVLDTWLYNQEDVAEPLARAILARLAP